MSPALVKRALIEPLALGLPLSSRAAAPQGRALRGDRADARSGADAALQPADEDRPGERIHRRSSWQESIPQSRTGASSRPLPRHRTAATLNRTLAYEWKYILADNDLPKVTGTASLGGVDVGFPLLDDRLLDFSLGLPPEEKVRGRKLRYFFKEALRGFLPDEIIAKKKHGFGLPFGVWLMRDRALREFARTSVDALAAARHHPARAVAGTVRRTHRRARRLLWRDGVDPDDARAVAGPAAASDRTAGCRCLSPERTSRR